MSTSTLELENHYAERYAEAVSAVLSEPVIRATPFGRRGLYTQKLLGRAGFLPFLLARMYAKKQAGGLPQRFMLAVTPTNVRAFEYTARGRKRDQIEIGDEVAVWRRDAIAVTWQDGPPYQVDVTIEAAGEGEKVLCRTGKGQTTEAFLQLMSDPTATA
jgi:hypothetical protein